MNFLSDNKQIVSLFKKLMESLDVSGSLFIYNTNTLVNITFLKLGIICNI